MDCLFNMQVPKSTEFEYIIRPKGKLSLTIDLGKTFISGLASSYSLAYNHELLKDYISKEDFHYMINNFNEILFQFWPCPLCFCMGYMFSPCTLGLSFLLPNTCISDAERSLRGSIEYFNK